MPTSHRRVTIAAAILTLPVALFSLGYLFHTELDPTILGRYTPRYLLYLAVWYLGIVPGVFLFWRFSLGTQHIALPSGRQLTIRPRLKLTAAFIAALIFYLLLDMQLRIQLARATITHANDVFHPYLQNTLRPDNPALPTNRWGFRGEEIEPAKPAGTYRVFFYGGSTVICENVAFEQTHCRVLERQLRSAYPQTRIELQNLGTEWHCSAHSLWKLATRTEPFSPDLVIVYHAINDLVRSFESDQFTEGPFQSDYGHYLGPVVGLRHPWRTGWFLQQAAAGQWLSDFRRHFVRVRGPEGQGTKGLRRMAFRSATAVEVDDWPSLEPFRRNMRTFVELARLKGYQVVLATQPSLFHDGLSPEEQEVLVFAWSHQFSGRRASDASMQRGMQQFNEATRQLARELDMPLVDLERQMPKTLEYLYDDVHYTVKGNQLIGEAMARAIIELDLVGQRQKSAGQPPTGRRPAEPPP